MAFDIELMGAVERGEQPPTVRFFRWSEPTVSYGRLQRPEELRDRIPAGWPAVRRPTGGGLVFHDRDLCVSLAWPRGLGPLPERPKDQYPWIHTVIRQALEPFLDVRMAPGGEGSGPPVPFARRECFTQPVGFDLLRADRKIVGGAIAGHRGAWLYQGSLQDIDHPALEASLRAAFAQALGG